MLSIVTPIFLVILAGYLFAKKNKFSKDAGKLINDYVLFVALPALLFLSIAQAKPAELLHWEFVIATLAGVFVAYMLGIFLSMFKSISAPKSSIVAMAACYGTTGYMGVPIAIAVFGEAAAVPAAIATILHNIPVIMAVIITYGVFSNDGKNKSGFSILLGAIKTTLLNPLTLSVIAGMIFSFFYNTTARYFKNIYWILSWSSRTYCPICIRYRLVRFRYKISYKYQKPYRFKPYYCY